MYCSFCGDDAGNHAICPSCGRKVNQSNEPKIKETVPKISPVQRKVVTNTGTKVPKLLVVILLLFLPIIGLVLVPFSDFDKKTKIGIFVVIGLIFFVGMGLFLLMTPSEISETNYEDEAIVEVKNEVVEESVSLSDSSLDSLSDDKMDMIIEYTVNFDDDDWNGLVMLSVNTTMDETEAMYTYSVLKAIGMTHIKNIEVGDNEYSITTTDDKEVVLHVKDDLLVAIQSKDNELFNVEEGILDSLDE